MKSLCINLNKKAGLEHLQHIFDMKNNRAECFYKGSSDLHCFHKLRLIGCESLEL